MSNDEKELLERIARDLEVLVRIQIAGSQADKSQSEMIRELNALGLSSADTARYLGTTVKIVGTIVARGRSKGTGARNKGRVQ